MNAATQTQWLVLPADLGRCSNQDRRISLSSAIESKRLLEAIAHTSLSTVPLRDIALTCFVVLLHRHSNQSTVTISATGETGGALHATFDFEDQTVFFDVVRAMSKFFDMQSSTGRSSQNFDAPTNFLFRTVNHQNIDPDSINSGGLCLICTEAETVLNLQLIFDGQSFRIERMQEFLSQYKQLLEQTAAGANGRILDYSLVTPYGQTLLPDPTQAIDVPQYPLLTESFADVVKMQSSAVAIRKDGKSWTYQELDHSSLSLACHLCQTGIVPGDVVAVSGPRSYGVVSSVLAVFRSGGTLLTIDPKLPLERQATILSQAGAKYLVRIGESKEIDQSIATVIYVDPATGMPEVPRSDQVNAQILPALDPTAPAYIFFTSGSTGTPKGVVGNHRGLAHFLDWQRKTFDIGPGDRAAQITTLSFDMVLRDMFLALSCGATLCIPAEEDVLNPTAILPWMAAENISVLHLVPSLLRAWISHAPPDLALPNLRRVFLAGEPLTDTLVRSFREAFGTGALITNFYGPTETTLIKCFHPVIEPEPGVQPIGRPQPQTQVLILNRLGKLCGVHEIGEIAIRTPFRTLGYLNAPEATAQVFVPNPFREDSSDLIYKTGDSGFYRADGILVMRGRMDNQVKIRGMRVEPGEVEAAITHCEAIAEVAVVAHEHETNGKFLAAYIVPKHDPYDEAKLASEVREFLRERLPENMVPSTFVVMRTLPLLPNGKIDRKSLKAPTQSIEADIASTPTGLDAPQSAREAELLAVWQSVLGHSRVGVNDSFVELGGDSLTAISALVRMQRLGIPDLFARGIFQGWSIRQITEMTEGKTPDSLDMAMPPKVKTNLLVNVLRGLMVLIVVASHWFEGLLKRLPKSLSDSMDVLLPLFNAGAPGFALLFGVGLGYTSLPKYLTDSNQSSRTLRITAWIVAFGAFILGISSYSLILFRNEANNATVFFGCFYGPLLYYAIAIASASSWFKFIAKNEFYYKNLLILASTYYLTYRIGLSFLPKIEFHGFFQLIKLMLVDKFSYLNMSTIVLFGLGMGIYLSSWTTRGLMLHKLTKKTALAGGAACIASTLYLVLTTGSLEGLKNQWIMPVWRWVFYGGILLLAASLLGKILVNYEKLVSPIRIGLNLLGVIGQISLPVFVLHFLVQNAKVTLVLAGVSDILALSMSLFVFFALSGWMMFRIYELYYGVVGRSDSRFFPASIASKESAGAH